MNYLDCPNDHLKAALIGLPCVIASLLVLGVAFPLPDTIFGWAIGIITGAVTGFAGIRTSTMIGHHLTCKKEDG